MNGNSSYENSNPKLYDRLEGRRILDTELDDSVPDPFDVREIFDLIRDINDPEYPLTLERLNVVSADGVRLEDESVLEIEFTPTVPHCSMASVIGLAIVVKLKRSLPARFKSAVLVAPGAHADEKSINKQLNDKERVAAALENSAIREAINECLKPRC